MVDSLFKDASLPLQRASMCLPARVMGHTGTGYAPFFKAPTPYRKDAAAHPKVVRSTFGWAKEYV
ncbi:hypothetical protein [Galbibacter sp. PAP.153]|uniref:hypothetical protein n=1 Tax=Galbibacter sp. PAP.153 TaxID=3104623 RepID=UPI003008A0D2